VTDDIDADIAEILADPGPPFVPSEAQIRASNPYLWTPEERRMAGIPETSPDAGKNLPEHIRRMVSEMGAHNSSTSR